MRTSFLNVRRCSNRIFVLHLLLFTLCGAAKLSLAEERSPAVDWQIVPGERVGGINWATDEAGLVALFGAEHVVAEEISTGEGDFAPGTVVFPADDTRRLSILWKDQEHRRHPRYVELRGAASEWKTDKGITLGMSLQVLEQLNTMPFQLFGFGHDGSGIVHHCGDGVLKELGYPVSDGNGTDVAGKKIWISLNPYRADRVDGPEELFASVLGDDVFSSGHPSMQALNPRIDYMKVLINAPEDRDPGQAAPFTIVAFGDSTTAPREVDGRALRVYADLLRDEFAQRGLPVNIINAGVGGHTTTDARSRFEQDVLAHNPNLVIIQFGLNDSCIDLWDGKDQPRVTQEDYATNLRYFVETLHARDCRVILMTANPMRWTEPLLQLYGKAPFDVNDPWGFNLTNRAYATSVRTVAQELKASLVDVYQGYLDYSAAPGQAAEDLLLDGMHPNDRGHALIADWLIKAIEPMLKTP